MNPQAKKELHVNYDWLLNLIPPTDLAELKEAHDLMQGLLKQISGTIAISFAENNGKIEKFNKLTAEDRAGIVPKVMPDIEEIRSAVNILKNKSEYAKRCARINGWSSLVGKSVSAQLVDSLLNNNKEKLNPNSPSAYIEASQMMRNLMADFPSACHLLSVHELARIIVDLTTIRKYCLDVRDNFGFSGDKTQAEYLNKFIANIDRLMKEDIADAVQKLLSKNKIDPSEDFNREMTSVVHCALGQGLETSCLKNSLVGVDCLVAKVDDLLPQTLLEIQFAKQSTSEQEQKSTVTSVPRTIASVLNKFLQENYDESVVSAAKRSRDLELTSRELAKGKSGLVALYDSVYKIIGLKEDDALIVAPASAAKLANVTHGDLLALVKLVETLINYHWKHHQSWFTQGKREEVLRNSGLVYNDTNKAWSIPENKLVKDFHIGCQYLIGIVDSLNKSKQDSKEVKASDLAMLILRAITAFATNNQAEVKALIEKLREQNKTLYEQAKKIYESISKAQDAYKYAKGGIDYYAGQGVKHLQDINNTAERIAKELSNKLQEQTTQLLSVSTGFADINTLLDGQYDEIGKVSEMIGRLVQSNQVGEEALIAANKEYKEVMQKLESIYEANMKALDTLESKVLELTELIRDIDFSLTTTLDMDKFVEVQSKLSNYSSTFLDINVAISGIRSSTMQIADLLGKKDEFAKKVEASMKDFSEANAKVKEIQSKLNFELRENVQGAQLKVIQAQDVVAKSSQVNEAQKKQIAELNSNLALQKSLESKMKEDFTEIKKANDEAISNLETTKQQTTQLKQTVEEQAGTIVKLQVAQEVSALNYRNYRYLLTDRAELDAAIGELIKVSKGKSVDGITVRAAFKVIQRLDILVQHNLLKPGEFPGAEEKKINVMKGLVIFVNKGNKDELMKAIDERRTRKWFGPTDSRKLYDTEVKIGNKELVPQH